MAYVGNNLDSDIQVNKYNYIATSGQTDFACTYDRAVDVYVNGLKLANSDFTATDGVKIVLDSGLNAGDIVDINAYFDVTYGGYDDSQIDALIDTAVGVVPKVALPISSQLAGTFSLSNTVKTLGAGKFLYTGNSSSQEINIGVSSIDFTQSSNGTGYYHDRAAGDCIVKNDAGTAVESGEISFKDVTGVDGIIKVHIKGRSEAKQHLIFDGVRGSNKHILTALTNAEGSEALTFTGYTSNGFTLGNNANTNGSGITYVTYIELYTHIKWGLTSQGKRYIEAYNPVTNMGMIVYQGSGIAGHQIPHSLGIELDYVDAKSLGTSSDWYSSGIFSSDETGLRLNTTDSVASGLNYIKSFNTQGVLIGDGTTMNGINNSYVLYYKAKSAIWTCGIYNGTGASGNKIVTVDSEGNECKPHELIIKRIDSTGSWALFDNKRWDTGSGVDEYILLNSSNAGSSEASFVSIYGNTLYIDNAASAMTNASGGQYFYQASLIPTTYTSDLDGYFDYATDTTNLQLTDGLFSISNGYTSNGADNKIITKSGTLIPTNGWED
jgi:hypothetical protein